jgi:hypothetical protein
MTPDPDGTSIAALALSQIVLHTLIEKGLLPKAEACAKLQAAMDASTSQNTPANRDAAFLLRKVLEAAGRQPDPQAQK